VTAARDHDEACTRCGATPETGLRDGCPECQGVVGPINDGLPLSRRTASAAHTPSRMQEKEDARMAELRRDYVEQLEALDAERYEAQTRLAQVLGWGDFRECSPAQTEQFAEWANEVGLTHLGNPHVRPELFA